MSERWTAWGPAALWAGVLFFLSAIPGADVPPWLFPGEDKLAHLVLYAVLGATLARGRRRGAPGMPAWIPPTWGWLYAVSDEWHQSFVPGRDASLGDLAADTVGLLAGYGLLSVYLTRRAHPEHPRH